MQLESLNALHLWNKSLANNNNTYKFALGLSLLKHITKGKQKISFVDVASDFIEFYWNQALIYKIKHSVTEKQIPLVIQKIQQLVPTQYNSLPYRKVVGKRDFNKSTLIQNIFSRKSILRNPISRFQYGVRVINPDGDPSGEGWLYSWDEYKEQIIINDGLHQVVEANKHLYYDIVVFKAVKFLEQFNISPRLSQKISIDVERQHISSAMRSMFGAHSSSCFYCGRYITENKFHLDHFIPWEYMLSNDIWNLVFSCPTCNNGPGGKFIKLPEEIYLEKLNKRNREKFNTYRIDKHFQSPSQVEERLENLYTYALKSGYEVWQPNT